MNTSPLRDLLAVKLGLDAETAGPSFLAMVAKRSLGESGYADLGALVGAAAAGGEAWRILLDHAVVSETWFFRDSAPFDHLVGVVRTGWQGVGRMPVRILSCPCSTGEEPYSIAIALADAGLPPGACTIDAADVSPRALSAARAGVFGSRSFRGGGHMDRARYFDEEPSAGQWRIKPALQAMVQFRPANLLSAEGLQHEEPYDIILCRNVLIYLHAQARDRVMATLRQLLAPGGVLIVGHAEAAIAREHGFIGEGTPGAFAFVKTGRTTTEKAPASGPAPRSAPKRPAAARTVRPRPHRERTTARAAAAAASTGLDVTLERIRELGDVGRTEDAILACREHLRRTPDSADGYFLLGVLYGVLRRNDAAATALRRALYLDPGHAAALVHLALAHDASGDRASAARLRGRAARPERSGRSGQ